MKQIYFSRRNAFLIVTQLKLKYTIHLLIYDQTACFHGKCLYWFYYNKRTGYPYISLATSKSIVHSRYEKNMIAKFLFHLMDIL